MSKKSKQNHAITGIVEDLSFSDTDVWLWVRMPPSEYEFLDYSAREILAHDFDISLSNLLVSDEKPMEFQLIVSSRPFATDKWVRELYSRNLRNNPSEELPSFLAEMHDRVEAFNFREKIVYLGVNVGRRSDYSPSKQFAALGDTSISKILNQFSGIVDENISEKEFDYWDSRAKGMRSSLLTSRIKAQQVRSEEIAYLIRKNFYPAMESPSEDYLSIGDDQRWGAGEIGTLVDAELENNPRWLKITQMIDGEIQTGYRATLCFSKFPAVILYPEKSPWMHYASHLPFSVDMYSRFTLEPTRKVRREVDRKLKEAKDQAMNQTSAGGNISLAVQEQLLLGEELEFALGKDSTPWVYGRHRIVVEASTVEELKERAQGVIDHYKGLDILVVWPTGDQLNLLKEALPSDKVRVKSYWQRQDLSIISTGVPAGTGTTGDKVELMSDGTMGGWLGPYIGYTTGNTQEPVFLSPHSSVAKNRSPGISITGESGSGKTFCALTVTYEMALSGVWTVFVDPKGDALRMQGMPGLERAQFLDLKDGNEGLLDPFTMTDEIGQAKELAYETLTLLSGGRKNISHTAENELLKAIDAISQNDDPSLGKVVDYLISNKLPEAEALGRRLKSMANLPFARLCFSSGDKRRKLRIDSPLTVITLLGLDLPDADSAESASPTLGNQLALGVMYLLTSFIRNLMTNSNKSQAKALMIDEAWAITSTQQGVKLINQVARMGRSHNTIIGLVSQNSKDFNAGVKNAISTRIVFRSKAGEEIDAILDYLELPNEQGTRDVVAGLNTGECLIKDSAQPSRISRVRIDGWNPIMNDAFQTNPTLRSER